MNNAELNTILREANLEPHHTFAESPGSRTLVRATQFLAAIIAALLLGVGVAWATSGTNPFATLFAEKLQVTESETGLDSFSFLEPMTQESLDALPPRVKQMALFRAFSNATQRNLEAGLPPFGEDKSKFEPSVTHLSAVGSTQTNLGTPVYLVVADDEICSYNMAGAGISSNCTDLENVDRGRTVNWGSESRNRLLRVTGIYTDRVAAIDVLEDAKPPIEIPGNVLELRNMKWQDITLVGLDSDGNELFRNKVPLNMRS